MTVDSAIEWYRFTCTRCSTWWTDCYQVHRCTDDAGVRRSFYRRNGLPCEAPAYAGMFCSACRRATVRAELLDHPATRTVPHEPVFSPPEHPAYRPDPSHHGKAYGWVGGHVKFKAVISLDGTGQPYAAGQYPSGTHRIMIRVRSLRSPGLHKYFPAATVTDHGHPLRPGDRDIVVTFIVPDDEASHFLGPGQPISLWDGSDVGRGTVTRRVFNWPEVA